MHLEHLHQSLVNSEPSINVSSDLDRLAGGVGGWATLGPVEPRAKPWLWKQASGSLPDV